MDNSYKINDKVVEAVSKPAIKNTNAVWKEKVEQISTFVREVKKGLASPLNFLWFLRISCDNESGM